MEQNNLFPLKYRLRKTDEPVEIVAWETAEKGARNENDWVSYIDANGVEHIKEHLTLEWDFVVENPFESSLFKGFTTDLPKFDPWEARRYELVKGMWLSPDFNLTVDHAVKRADELIAAMKKSQEATEE